MYRFLCVCPVSSTAFHVFVLLLVLLSAFVSSFVCVVVASVVVVVVVVVVDVVVVVVVVVYLKRLRIVLRCAKAGCGRRTSSS